MEGGQLSQEQDCGQGCQQTNGGWTTEPLNRGRREEGREAVREGVGRRWTGKEGVGGSEWEWVGVGWCLGGREW